MDTKDIQTILGAALHKFLASATTSCTINNNGGSVSIIVLVDSGDKKKENCIRKCIRSKLDKSVKFFSLQLETSSSLVKAASLSSKVIVSLDNERGTLIESSNSFKLQATKETIELDAVADTKESDYTYSIPSPTDPKINSKAFLGKYIMVVGADDEGKKLITILLEAAGATVTSTVTRNGEFYCCLFICFSYLALHLLLTLYIIHLSCNNQV